VATDYDNKYKREYLGNTKDAIFEWILGFEIL